MSIETYLTFCLAALGLALGPTLTVILANSLRYAGTAYPIWMGWKLFRSNSDLAIATDRARPKGSCFLQGLVVIMSNLKMLVVVGALMPPFMTKGGNAFHEVLLLGTNFMLIAAIGDALYAITVGKAGAFL